MLEAALDGAGVLDLESVPLLEADEAWAASGNWDVMAEYLKSREPQKVTETGRGCALSSAFGEQANMLRLQGRSNYTKTGSVSILKTVVCEIQIFTNDVWEKRVLSDGFWGVLALFTLSQKLWADEKGRAESLGISWQTHRGTQGGSIHVASQLVMRVLSTR